MAKPESLLHRSTVVVVDNRAEFEYIKQWSEDNGKVFGINNEFNHFPFCLDVSGSLVGWTAEMDRALYYMPFIEFLYRIGYRMEDGE